jgi:hypothetical protein
MNIYVLCIYIFDWVVWLVVDVILEYDLDTASSL